MDQKEREYFHSMMNKVTAIEGKLRKLKKVAKDDETIIEVDKVKKLNTDLQELLVNYREYMRSL